ncbi:tRNA (adenosine(37)-N6)-threonylcarbamoyltransferase complex ATPase subunit type 1 TsaE [Psychrobacter sp. AH5]|uniref:tRNA (adenosine(37)-N6)-threonylcarbamoyltransferase complex ATPase subunit type 1 TsaE n=1 Tax=Psychrobacter sp. AH5 TaxID=2937433 RepID=UPI003340EBB3
MSNTKLNDTTSLQTLRLSSEADTQTLAQQLAKLPIKGSVWLSGDLGAGKTTLTRYWLQALGHKGAVKSPTYTLVEPYQLKQSDGLVKPVYHADLYRLQDPEELSFIGFDEYLDEPDALIIIEWASRADSYLPPPTLFIDIVEADNGARQVELRLSKIGQAQNLNLATLRI